MLTEALYLLFLSQWCKDPNNILSVKLFLFRFSLRKIVGICDKFRSKLEINCKIIEYLKMCILFDLIFPIKYFEGVLF